MDDEYREIRELLGIPWNEEYKENPERLIRLFRKLLDYRLWREIYMVLIKRAIDKQTIYYSELAREVNRIIGDTLLPESGNQLGRALAPILGIISWYEYLCNRPLLTSIVIRKLDKTPGEGFFRMEEYLPGMININIEEEQEKVFACWGVKVRI